MLDESLPETPYTVDIFHTKVQLVFDHVLTAYGDNGESAYDVKADYQFPQDVKVELAGPLDVNRIADDVVARILSNPDFAAQVASNSRRRWIRERGYAPQSAPRGNGADR